MNEPNRAPGLLEHLAAKANCIYLSDLYQRAYLPAVKKAVADVDKNLYTLKQWNDAAEYISKQNLRFGTTEEVIVFLQQL